MNDTTIYRVISETAGSLQPVSTFWKREEVHYCGSDRQEARKAYHASTPFDHGGSYGSKARRTRMEAIPDTGTDDALDDAPDDDIETVVEDY